VLEGCEGDRKVEGWREWGGEGSEGGKKIKGGR
jgi:hypothetical protein